MKLTLTLMLCIFLTGCIDPGTAALFLKESMNEQGVQSKPVSYGDIYK